MKTSDILEETYLSLTVNKVRSGLTMLGIIIGIGSVIAMVSIGQGAQNSIEATIQSLGSNLLVITPGEQRTPGVQVSAGRGSAQTLTAEDATAIRNEIASVKAVAPEISRRYQITAPGKNTNTQVIGTVSDYPEIRNIEIAEGSFITQQNSRNLAKVAVLGPTTRNDLFDEEADALGKTIRINGINFTVIGITQSKGGGGFGSQDDMIFIPIETAQRFLIGNEFVSTISVQARDQQSMASAQEEITNLLLERHKIKDAQAADFSIMNQADIIETVSSITDTFTILLAAIAGISLLVGGIGIMNMMLTTVTERTKEIGLRKAVGAKQKDITAQFLAESIALTFFGGFFGILFGWACSLVVSRFAGIPTQVSASSIILAFGVSAAIGIIFGYYPAKKAARLNPIQALRYE